MEEVYYSETMALTHQATKLHNTEGSNIHIIRVRAPKLTLGTLLTVTYIVQLLEYRQTKMGSTTECCIVYSLK